jgi:hypothetical protein
MGLCMKIDKDVPAPVVTEAVVYPFEAMAVGDSFFVEAGVLTRLCNAHGRAGRKLGRRFTARRVEGGVRIWRVS